MIDFHYIDVDKIPFKDTMISNWLTSLASQEDKEIESINYIFCTDEYLLDINKQYLNHDYYTDIITFPYKQGPTIQSDVFISLDRVKENASNFDVDFQDELLRVISHGLLHLMGYGDKTEEDQKAMRLKEDEAIQQFKDLYNVNF